MKVEIAPAGIPLWKGENGNFQVDVNVLALTAPLPESADAIASLSFAADGKVSIGSEVSVGVSAKTSMNLAALFEEQTGADPGLVAELNLGPLLQRDNLLLALDLGGKADVSAEGSYKYSVLTAGADLEAGVDGRLVHTRSYPRSRPAGEIVNDFFTNLALPGTITTPPPPGQVTSLEFGGYLNFGVNASAGYHMKGAHDFQRFDALKLSEHYELSVAGKLAVTARLAGRFSVEVRAADDDHWARVTVKRRRSKELQIAADLKVGAQIDTQGLPPTGKEFLEALLGLRAKNWINQAEALLEEAAAIHTKEDLIKRLDGLADLYVSRHVGKAVDQFLPQDVINLMARLQKIVDSYKTVENSAVALFDRYFDVAGAPLLDRLKEIEALASWDQFRGEVDPMLWNIVQQLTGGNALDFVLKQTTGLESVQAAARKTISLITDTAHQEIRQFIGVGKKEFGLDPVVAEIEKFDSPQALKTSLSETAQRVVERIIGKAVSQINDEDFEAITSFVGEIRKGEQGFFQKFDRILQEAASQSFSLDIAASYDRSDERTALIDVDIRLLNDDPGRTANARGRHFLRKAGIGDFSEILAQYDPDVIRLRAGSLTHRLSTSSGLSINVAGWHNRFQYSDTYKVVTKADQQIRSTAKGMLNVFTTVEMSSEHDRTRKMNRHEEAMHANFTLRFLAETRTLVEDSKFDQRDRDYLLDVITGQSATYTSTLSDSDTTPKKLDHLLAFAKALGLDQKGATPAALKPILQLQNGSYGPVNAEYRVQFSKAGLNGLFGADTVLVTREQIRTILERIVISNYAGNAGLAAVGWLYCSDKVRDAALGNPNFVDTDGMLRDMLQDGLPVTNPFPGTDLKPELRNERVLRVLVRSLFLVERDLIEAFQQLEQTVQKTRIKLKDLEKVAQQFGSALNEFESSVAVKAGGISPTFAVFDGLIQLATPALQTRGSALALKVGPDGDGQRQMLFQLVSEEKAVAVAGGD